jgi:hypothetical protein
LRGAAGPDAYKVEAKMSDLRQAAQQALEALERADKDEFWREQRDAITALKAALEQQAEPSQWRDMVVVSLVREGINKHKARELADHFATQPVQQAEPICPECKAAVLYECVACSSNNYPPQQQAEPPPEWPLVKNILDEYGLDAIAFVAEWKAAQLDKTSFTNWWNGDYDDSENPHEPDSAAYWAWAGWQAAQRPWVGLTKVQQDDFADAYGSYEAVCAIEAKLKERNT